MACNATQWFRKWWTSISTSPTKFGGGGGQMSLPPPPELWDQRTLKVISRPASARAAGKNGRQRCNGPCQKTVSSFECINGLFFRIYFRSTSPSAALLTYLPCAISVRFSLCIRASGNTEIFSRDEANNQLKSADFIFTRHLSSKEQWWSSNLLEFFVGFSAVLPTIP